MGDIVDAEYYRRREADERAKAEAAVDPVIRLIHSRLADAYSERIAGGVSSSRAHRERLSIAAPQPS